MKALRGILARKYGETVSEAAKALGVSASSVSRRIVEVTSQKLWEFKERVLAVFLWFAIFLDTIHRGEAAFILALGIDEKGEKQVLGFCPLNTMASRSRPEGDTRKARRIASRTKA